MNCLLTKVQWAVFSWWIIEWAWWVICCLFGLSRAVIQPNRAVIFAQLAQGMMLYEMDS